LLPLIVWIVLTFVELVGPPGIRDDQTVPTLSALLIPRSKMNRGTASHTPWTTIIFLTSTKITVALVETIRHGWAINLMKSTTSSDKEMSAAPNTFPQCQIVRKKTQSRPVIIGRAMPITLQTLIRYPSFTVIPTIRIWHRAPALMGEYFPL